MDSEVVSSYKYKVLVCGDLLSNIHLLLKLIVTLYFNSHRTNNQLMAKLNLQRHEVLLVQVMLARLKQHTARRGHVFSFLRKLVPRRGNYSKDFRTQVESGK